MGQPTDSPDGSTSGDRWTIGTYGHGLFHNTDLRANILKQIASRKGTQLRLAKDGFSQHAEFDKLADLVRHHLDMSAVCRMVGLA